MVLHFIFLSAVTFNSEIFLTSTKTKCETEYSGSWQIFNVSAKYLFKKYC